MKNSRLKFGIGILVLGIIVQFVSEIQRQQEVMRNSGAFLTCITYGSIGNDCEERFSVSVNPFGWMMAALGFFIILGHITGKIASKKGRDYSNYFWLGFFLGVIGIIIVALMSNQKPKKVKIVQDNSKKDQKKCKYCAELIKKDAIFCKHCRNKLD